jgi:hypothetical protein
MPNANDKVAVVLGRKLNKATAKRIGEMTFSDLKVLSDAFAKIPKNKRKIGGEMCCCAMCCCAAASDESEWSSTN